MANLLPVVTRQLLRRRDCGLSLKVIMKKDKRLSEIPPGEILFEDFLKPLGISQYRLAKEIGVPIRRITEIVQGKRAITADTALRLGRFFKMAPEFWLNLQTHYDLEKEVESLGRRLDREVKPWPHLAAA